MEQEATPSRMAPDEFRAEIRRKGWTLRALAVRWGNSENWIHKLAGNPNRPAHWDDAVRGLPLVVSRTAIVRR